MTHREVMAVAVTVTLLCWPPDPSVGKGTLTLAVPLRAMLTTCQNPVGVSRPLVGLESNQSGWLLTFLEQWLSSEQSEQSHFRSHLSEHQIESVILISCNSGN